jgi:hypothetical protein
MRNMVNTLARIKQQFPKRQFDVASKDDLRVYKHFLETGNWGKIPCPFELEWPWLSIPDMISHKIAADAVAKV